MPNVTGWACLPYEMEEIILGNLSFQELVETSSTCKRFDQVFRERLAEEQKCRCNLAITCFGKERVTRIANLVNRFLKRQPLGLEPGENVRWGSWWMSGDGNLIATECPFVSSCKGVKVLVFVSSGEPRGIRLLHIRIFLHGNRRLSLAIGKRTLLRVMAHGDEDVAGASLVQALLSGDFAPIVGEGWPLPDVHFTCRKAENDLTSGGLKAQIAPLLPLVKSWDVCKNPRDWKVYKEPPEYGQGGQCAKRLIMLHVNLAT